MPLSAQVFRCGEILPRRYIVNPRGTSCSFAVGEEEVTAGIGEVLRCAAQNSVRKLIFNHSETVWMGFPPTERVRHNAKPFAAELMTLWKEAATLSYIPPKKKL